MEALEEPFSPDGLTNEYIDGLRTEAGELSDLELLAAALEDAMDAYGAGVIIGPRLDAVAYQRAVRRARRQDAARVLRTAGAGDAA